MDIYKKKFTEFDLFRDKIINKLNKKKKYIADYFPKYASREKVSYFLARVFLFEKILNTRGCLIELGVGEGGGLSTWAQISSILEPMDCWRKIYGFDTFEGFPSTDENDKLKKSKFQWKKGDINEGNYKEILSSLDLLKRTPYPPHYPTVELIKGDILVTAEKFIKENPHLLISMLYIDVDLYAPTKKALEVFLPRMPKGSLIAFDELNHPKWPGETLAFLEKFDIKKYDLRTARYQPRLSYLVL